MSQTIAEKIAREVLEALRRRGLDCVGGGYDDVSGAIRAEVLRASQSVFQSRSGADYPLLLAKFIADADMCYGNSLVAAVGKDRIKFTDEEMRILQECDQESERIHAKAYPR